MEINNIVIYAFFVGFLWGVMGATLVCSQLDILDTLWSKALVLILSPVLYLIIGVYIISRLIYWKITDIPIVQDLTFIFRVRFMNYRREDKYDEAVFQEMFDRFLELRKAQKFAIPARIMEKYIDIFMNR